MPSRVTVHELPVRSPFRLELTASALRRVPTNVVDVITPAGEYMHAFHGEFGPLVATVAQRSDTHIVVRLEGDTRETRSREQALEMVSRTLGVDRDVTGFAVAASKLHWLAPLAERFMGIKPPRYRSLWETFVNAVVFQQVSLHSATATVRRMVMSFGKPVMSDGVAMYTFPDAATVLSVSDGELRALGISAARAATLRRAGEAIASGMLNERVLDDMPSRDAALELARVKGVGPWTAAVMLLRGFGRLDVFPMNDSGVARNIAMVASRAAGGDSGSMPDVSEVLSVLGELQGMLYFHLLLARLEERGEIGCPSVAPP